MKLRPAEERFWEKVAMIPEHPCWEWIAGKNQDGYGTLGIAKNGKRTSTTAHRVSWEIHNGPIPSDRYVCHHCDNPGCVNPSHLFLGTQRDNMVDMMEKGRACHGEDRAEKLLKEDVEYIRAVFPKRNSRELAKMFGVKRGYIKSILRGEWWVDRTRTTNVV